MLRIDPTGDDFPAGDATSISNYAIPLTNPFKAGVGNPADDVGDDEIWAYGLRNPFRDSFDRLTGDLWIGDVGQGAREEIDFQPASSTGGENYGWRLREGTIQPNHRSGPALAARAAGCVDPVYDYDRDADQFGGTGDHRRIRVSRPRSDAARQVLLPRLAELDGTRDDNYWMFDPANPFGTVTNIDCAVDARRRRRQFPVSFGEDAVGNLYIAYIGSGEVYRIVTNQFVPEPAAAPACSGNWHVSC